MRNRIPVRSLLENGELLDFEPTKAYSGSISVEAIRPVRSDTCPHEDRDSPLILSPMSPLRWPGGYPSPLRKYS